MKLCKDCKYFVAAAHPMMNVGCGPNYRDPMCAHPNAKFSVVDGSLQTPCVQARGDGGATDRSICWPDAKLFEEAPQFKPKPDPAPYQIIKTWEPPPPTLFERIFGRWL